MFLAYKYWNEHGTQSAVRQSRLSLQESKHYLVETETAEKVRAEQAIVERLSVSPWCRPRLRLVELDTSDRRLVNPSALFHMFNLRCWRSAWHVWMCLAYVLICFTQSRRGGAKSVWELRYQSCWTYLASHRVFKQTRSSTFKCAGRVGWAGCALSSFSLQQLNWFHFHFIKQTHSLSGMTDFRNIGLSQAWYFPVICHKMSAAEIYWAPNKKNYWK